MARWFRSEPMEYVSLIVNEDAAHDCLADLGKLGVIQFTDVRVVRLKCLLYKMLWCPIKLNKFFIVIAMHNKMFVSHSDR